MTNEEMYKTVDERQSAFKEYCLNHPCKGCKYANESPDSYSHCIFAWLADEASEEAQAKAGANANITRFVVQYSTISYTLGIMPCSMEVDATCAEDAVKAVRHAYPDACISSVKAKKKGEQNEQ